jgi:hypothetical protein
VCTKRSVKTQTTLNNTERRHDGNDLLAAVTAEVEVGRELLVSLGLLDVGDVAVVVGRLDAWDTGFDPRRNAGEEDGPVVAAAAALVMLLRGVAADVFRTASSTAQHPSRFVPTLLTLVQHYTHADLHQHY